MPFRSVSSLLLSLLTIVNEGSSLTIVNKGSSLKIVYEGLSLTIVNETTNFIKTVVIENDRFENDHFFKTISIKKRSFLKTIVSLYTIHCTQYAVHANTIHNTQYVLYTIHCSHYIVHKIHSTQCTVHNKLIQSTQIIVLHNTLYITPCTH